MGLASACETEGRTNTHLNFFAPCTSVLLVWPREGKKKEGKEEGKEEGRKKEKEKEKNTLNKKTAMMCRNRSLVRLTSL